MDAFGDGHGAGTVHSDDDAAGSRARSWFVNDAPFGILDGDALPAGLLFLEGFLPTGIEGGPVAVFGHDAVAIPFGCDAFHLRLKNATHEASGAGDGGFPSFPALIVFAKIAHG